MHTFLKCLWELLEDIEMGQDLGNLAVTWCYDT